MFQWLRSKVRNAVLAGFADAVEELKTAHQADANDDADQRLTALLANREPVAVLAEKRSSRNGVKS